MDVGVHILIVNMSLEYVSIFRVRILKNGNKLLELLSKVLGEFIWLREISREKSCLIINSLILALVRPE